MTHPKKQEQPILIYGNLLGSAPKPPDYERRTRELSENMAFAASLREWEYLSWFEKVWLEISYLFRRKK